MKHLYSRLVVITSIALVFGYLIVSAVWVPMTPDATSGSQFTATLWNNLVGNVNDLNARVSSLGSSLWATGATSSINYTAGNVGIGTTAPNKLLHLKTTTGTNAELDIQSGTKPYWGMYHDEASEQLRFWNGADRIVFASGGNVGIGTVTPGAKLEVNDNTLNSFAGKFIQTNSTNSNGVYIRTQTANAGDMGFGVFASGGTTPVLVARNNGNVGIGTTTPSAKLDVSSGVDQHVLIITHQNTSSGMTIASNNDANTAHPPLELMGNPIIMMSGKVGIWVTTPQYTLDTGSGGNIQTGYLYDMGAFCYAAYPNCISSYNVYQAAAPYSDQRLKKDIKTLDGEGSLNSILKLKPINFLWKDVVKNNQEGPQLGFIAQDIEKIFPQAMLTPLKSQPKEKLEITDSDGKKEIINDPKMVRYDRLIAPLVSAVQEFYTKWFTDSKELHSKIDLQQKEIDSLKSIVCLDHPGAEICK